MLYYLNFKVLDKGCSEVSEWCSAATHGLEIFAGRRSHTFIAQNVVLGNRNSGEAIRKNRMVVQTNKMTIVIL